MITYTSGGTICIQYDYIKTDLPCDLSDAEALFWGVAKPGFMEYWTDYKTNPPRYDYDAVYDYETDDPNPPRYDYHAVYDYETDDPNPMLIYD
jgi:hypothetical protein